MASYADEPERLAQAVPFLGRRGSLEMAVDAKVSWTPWTPMGGHSFAFAFTFPFNTFLFILQMQEAHETAELLAELEARMGRLAAATSRR